VPRPRAGQTRRAAPLSLARQLLARLSGRLHPARAAGPRLQGRAVQRLRGPAAGPTSLRRGQGRGGLRVTSTG
jgi:hypothetical protein